MKTHCLHQQLDYSGIYLYIAIKCMHMHTPEEDREVKTCCVVLFMSACLHTALSSQNIYETCIHAIIIPQSVLLLMWRIITQGFYFPKHLNAWSKSLRRIDKTSQNKEHTLPI